MLIAHWGLAQHQYCLSNILPVNGLGVGKILREDPGTAVTKLTKGIFPTMRHQIQKLRKGGGSIYYLQCLTSTASERKQPWAASHHWHLLVQSRNWTTSGCWLLLVLSAQSLCLSSQLRDCFPLCSDFQSFSQPYFLMDTVYVDKCLLRTLERTSFGHKIWRITGSVSLHATEFGLCTDIDDFEMSPASKKQPQNIEIWWFFSALVLSLKNLSNHWEIVQIWFTLHLSGWKFKLIHRQTCI